MIINAVTPNYAQNVRSNGAKSQNVQFKGNLGDKFVNKILNGSTVQPAEVMKEIKGTFGINSSKAEDVVESFVAKVKQLFDDKLSVTMQLNEAERKINKFPEEKGIAVRDKENEMISRFQKTMSAKDAELKAKDKEVAEMKAQLEKYQQVAKVKSVEEVGTIMPDKAIELLDEMIKNKVSARKSMVDFLLTGKGQEEAIAQIERNNQLLKAYNDGIMEIPEVKAKACELNDSRQYIAVGSYYTISMIEQALKGTSKGAYVKSKAIRQQIKDNAMAILTPMEDKRWSDTTVGAFSHKMDEALAAVERYHDGLAKGIQKMKARIGQEYKDIKFKEVEFAPEDSKLVYTTNGGSVYESDYQRVVNYGNSNY